MDYNKHRLVQEVVRDMRIEEQKEARRLAVAAEKERLRASNNNPLRKLFHWGTTIFRWS